MENEEEKIKRKCKIAYIGTQELKWILAGFRPDEYENISFPVLEGLPEGFVIMHMYLSMRRNALGLVVYHESFEEITAGMEYPVIKVHYYSVPLHTQN